VSAFLIAEMEVGAGHAARASCAEVTLFKHSTAARMNSAATSALIALPYRARLLGDFEGLGEGHGHAICSFGCTKSKRVYV